MVRPSVPSAESIVAIGPAAAWQRARRGFCGEKGGQEGGRVVRARELLAQRRGGTPTKRC
jgi:hypothetical protein